MKNIIIAFACCLCLAGCSLDKFPYDEVPQGNMWTTESLADNGINGIYNHLYNSDLSKTKPAETTGLNRNGIEALGFTTGYYNSVTILSSTAPSASFNWFTREWQFGFEGIHRCNDALANLHKAGLSEEKYQRYMCEARFMRAFFYHRLNMLFRGVPIYKEPVTADEATKGASTAEQVWELCIDDLTANINNDYCPDNTLNANYGRPSKGASYALRGQIYMWQKKWGLAIADFKKVAECGYGLWQGEWEELFKFENEKNCEMIFPLQFDQTTGYSDNWQCMVGARDHYDCWSELMPNPDFVDSYLNADGSAFDWNDYLSGWKNLTEAEREVFFLRDGLKTDTREEFKTVYTAAVQRIGQKVIDTYYLNEGNEARLRKAYQNRDPRLLKTVITPYTPMDCYSPYHNSGKTMFNKELRWPYVERGTDGDCDGKDMWHDKRNSFYYLYKKYNETEKGRYIDRTRCHCDFPIIRYTDIYLSLAEALNEIDEFDDALEILNNVRSRAGMIKLQKGEGDNAVNTRWDLRAKIQYEKRVELCLEGVNYFDEIRWGTYKATKCQNGTSGLKSMWGNIVGGRWYWKEYMTIWPVPLVETQRNTNLVPTEGWTY